ncbi:unnamed protein product [Brachionus calyciflorus]|uniref:RING-type E3 ubiquitin transferase n=1 Tax=Brachionus calyciflorus TaxID=104777 RepID=A0A814DXD8_9BILA|nr:unnamed protein product [Brachionus calyciflorus]
MSYKETPHVKSESEDFDKCAVCLQKFSSNYTKSYPSNCFHSFCFECIIEWSKVKYNCPLCKTSFDRIIYDLNSRLEYKAYFLEIKETENLPDVLPFSPQRSFLFPKPISKASWIANIDQAPIEFRMLIYKNNLYANPNQIQADVTLSNVNLDENETLSDNLECISYRPVIRFRDTRPEWYEKNPACTHRIMLFLYRELKAIAGIVPSGSQERLVHSLRSQLICIIVKLLKRYEIKSENFYREISEYIRPLKYVRHFQHELDAFAKSTCTDLVEYDAKVVYYKDESSLPLNNENDLIKIIPLKPLPENLSKYRLLRKEKTPLENYYESYEASIYEVQPSTSRAVEERDLSDSEQSSFCEIISPPRKKTPPLVHLESSGSDIEFSSVQSRSISSTTMQVETTDDTLKRKSRSKSPSRKHKKKHKKESRHRHKKKSHKKKSKKKKYKSKKRRSRTRSRSYSSSRSPSRSRSRRRKRQSRSRTHSSDRNICSVICDSKKEENKPCDEINLEQQNE